MNLKNWINIKKKKVAKSLSRSHITKRKMKMFFAQDDITVL